MGLRSGLKTFTELAELSYCQRRAFTTFEVGKQITSAWIRSGDTYTTPVSEVYDGVPMEIGSIITSDGETLARVETAALCAATAGSYYFVPGVDASTAGTLYIRLAAGGDANDKLVLVGFVRMLASSGTVEPHFGPEDLTDGGVENWTTATNLTSWTEVNPGGGGANGVLIQQDTILPFQGTYSAYIATHPIDQLLTGTNGGISQGTLTATVGTLKHFVLRYRTGFDNPVDAEARIRVEVAAGVYMATDGRSIGGSVTGMTLQNTGGEWRYALFAYRVPTGATGITVYAMLHNAGAGTLTRGSVNYDFISHRTVYRYEFAEPRLPLSGVPTIEVNNADPYMGAESIGLGALKALNTDDAYFENLLQNYDVIGRAAQVEQTGGFDDLQELTRDGNFPTYNGTIQSFGVDDLEATFDLQDTRALMAVSLPVQDVGAVFVSGVNDEDSGRPRPILVGGPKYNMKCPRIGIDANVNLPIFEVNDPTFGLGTPVMGQIAGWAYPDDEAANRRDTVRRVACVVATDTTLGRVSISQNPGPFEIKGSSAMDAARVAGMNDALDVTSGGVPASLFLTPNLYTAATLAATVQTALQTLDVNYLCSYSNTTHSFSISRNGGAALLLNIGAAGTNAHRSIYSTLGFVNTADPAPTSTYTGTAVYDVTRIDQLIIRIDGTGYRDDTTGTYTGVAGGGDTAIIYQGPDVLRFLLGKVLRRSPLEWDASSFNAFRGVGKLSHVLYLGGLGPSQRLTLQQIVDRIEVTCHTDIRMDGLGKWYWVPRAVSASEITTGATYAPVLTDRDFITFRSYKVAEDTYTAVSLTFDEHPVTGEVKTRGANNIGVMPRHNRPGARTFDGLWFEASDAQAQAWNMMLLAVLPRVHVEFTCKGRLIGKTVGDLIVVRRTRMLGPENIGMLNGDVFRILSISIDPQTHIVHCVAYKADLPRNTDQTQTVGVVPKMGKWPRSIQWPWPGRREVLGPQRPRIQ